LNIIIFGPPGAGKGTQSAFLVERKGMRHISTGDLFREHIKSNSALGQKAKGFMSKGELVPDSVVIDMVRDVFKQLNDKSFVLDGFPRTVAQAEALDELLASVGKKLGAVVFLEVAESILVDRLSGRRVCSNCGAVYHMTSSPSARPGVCDACDGRLVQRDDDSEDVIKDRLKVYERNTSPVKGYYQNQACLVEIDGLGSAEEVFARIQKVLN
jgi:adenylate kinase